MADEVSIDKQVFHNRLSSLITQWKTDKRSGDAVFGGVGAITVVMGKSDEAQGFNKSSAMQVGDALSTAYRTRLLTLTCSSGFLATNFHRLSS